MRPKHEPGRKAGPGEGAPGRGPPEKTQKRTTAQTAGEGGLPRPGTPRTSTSDAREEGCRTDERGPGCDACRRGRYFFAAACGDAWYV